LNSTKAKPELVEADLGSASGINISPTRRFSSERSARMPVIARRPDKLFLKNFAVAAG
jgi:hypothetical protein